MESKTQVTRLSVKTIYTVDDSEEAPKILMENEEFQDEYEDD